MKQGIDWVTFGENLRKEYGDMAMNEEQIKKMRAEANEKKKRLEFEKEQYETGVREQARRDAEAFHKIQHPELYGVPPKVQTAQTVAETERTTAQTGLVGEQTETEKLQQENYRSMIKERDARIAKMGLDEEWSGVFKIAQPVKSALGNDLYNYVMQTVSYGRETGDWSSFDEVGAKLDDPELLKSESSRVDPFGFKIDTQQATSDMAMLSNMYYQLRAKSNKFRKDKVEVKKPEFETETPTAPKDTIEFRADRARAITLLKAKKFAEADELIGKYKLNDEEKNKLLKEAGLKK